MRVVHLLRNSVFIRLLVTVGAMLTVAIFAPWNRVSGAGLRWLDTGGWPVQAVTMDASGRLYATGVGGASGGGVVFQLTPDATKTRWTAKVLYNFPRCSSKWQISYDPKYDPQGFARGRGVAVRSPTSCADGDGPRPELVMGSSRRIYGTTLAGGAAESGVIFELTPREGSAQLRQGRDGRIKGERDAGCVRATLRHGERRAVGHAGRVSSEWRGRNGACNRALPQCNQNDVDREDPLQLLLTAVLRRRRDPVGGPDRGRVGEPLWHHSRRRWPWRRNGVQTDTRSEQNEMDTHGPV